MSGMGGLTVRTRRVGSCPQKVGFAFWSPKMTLAMVQPPAMPEYEIHTTPGGKIRAVVETVVGNFLSGAIIGGIFGLVSGAFQTRAWASAWANAKTNGLSWGSISASYSGLQTLAREIRGKQDKYNNVVGACGSGALFSLPQGAQAAVRGCASFAMFSYVLESFMTNQSKGNSMEEKLLSGDK